MQAPPQRPHRRTGAARDAGHPDDSRSSARPTMYIAPRDAPTARRSLRMPVITGSRIEPAMPTTM